MAHLIAIGDCWTCGRTFTFNPHRVPSHPDEHGIRQPICSSCVLLANRMRERNGLEPIHVHPGAYDPAEHEDTWPPTWLRQTDGGWTIDDHD